MISHSNNSNNNEFKYLKKKYWKMNEMINERQLQINK